MTEIDITPVNYNSDVPQKVSLYPEDFTFENSEKLLYGEVRLDERLVQLRESAISAQREAIKQKMEYFFINLANIPQVLKQTFIKELSEKFPHIGYQHPDLDDIRVQEMLCAFNGKKFAQKFRVKKITNFFEVPDCEKYVVALTRRFASVMETYSW